MNSESLEPILDKMPPADADTLLRVFLALAHPDHQPLLRKKLAKLNADHPGSANPQRAEQLLRAEGPGILKWALEGLQTTSA